MSAISILKQSLRIRFIVTVAVFMKIVNFNVKFQSDSVNDKRVIASGIYTTFPPVKILMCSGHVIYIAACAFYFTWLQLTTMSLYNCEPYWL